VAHGEERQGKEVALGEVEAVRLGLANDLAALEEPAELLAAGDGVVQEVLLEEQGTLDDFLPAWEADPSEPRASRSGMVRVSAFAWVSKSFRAQRT
jgi:hypothetical protein